MTCCATEGKELKGNPIYAAFEQPRTVSVSDPVFGAPKARQLHPSLFKDGLCSNTYT